MVVFSLTREPCTTTSRQLIEKVHRIRRSPIECHLPACDKLINFHSPKRLWLWVGISTTLSPRALRVGQS